MPFKGIFYLKLWQPFCLAERNHLCNLVEGIQRNKSFNLFEFGTVVQEEMSFKSFRIWSSGDPPIQGSKTIYAILKEGIMGNSYVKLYEIRTIGSGGDVV